MNGVRFSASCRICLQYDAPYQIFNETGADIRAKLRKCLAEEVEDVEGYPRNICTKCKITLDNWCEFIDTYRHSCKLLKDSLKIVKTEADDVDTFTDHEQIDIKIEIIGTVPESNISNENNTNQILNKLKPVPGLKITKVSSQKKQKGNKNDKKLCSMKKPSPKQNKPNTPKIPKLKEQCQNKERLKPLNEVTDNNKDKEKMGENLQMPTVLCDYCGAIFNKKDKLKCHIQSQHSNKNVTCTICSKEFASEKRLKVHHRRLHSEKILPCEYCNTMFGDRGVLNGHIKSVHNKHLRAKKLYSCKYCDKVYKAPHARTAHERSIHTGLRPDVCSVCGKAFTHITYLKQHMRLHTGELPFKCPICERGYSQLCNMKSHLRQHKRSELNDTIMPKMRPSFLKRLKNC